MNAFWPEETKSGKVIALSYALSSELQRVFFMGGGLKSDKGYAHVHTDDKGDKLFADHSAD